MFSVVEEHAGEMVSHMVGTIEGHMVSWMKLFKFLLMLGALAATVTYEAAMSPPCGLWDYGQSGHIAGDPIYPRWYKVAFYCNETSFLAFPVSP